MKNFLKSAFCTVLITLLVLTAITAGVAMLLIPAVIGTPEAPAGESVSGIEYSSAPQNQALLVTDEAGRGALIYLNFEDITTHVYLFEEGAAENAALLPYNVTYRMKLTPDFAGRLCDRLGGIDLEIDGGINKENVKLVKDAGANVIVAGSTVFNEKDRAGIIKYLREV